MFDCQGAGVAFYSARDAVVVQNTFVGVATRMQVRARMQAYMFACMRSCVWVHVPWIRPTCDTLAVAN